MRRSTFIMLLGEMCLRWYPRARSWHMSTLNRISRPLTNAPWLWLIRLGRTDLRRKHSSFVITLYMTLQHEIGRKSEADCRWATFGRTINFVALIKSGIWPVRMNCWTIAQTSEPVKGQVALKNPLLKPSGPGICDLVWRTWPL